MSNSPLRTRSTFKPYSALFTPIDNGVVGSSSALESWRLYTWMLDQKNPVIPGTNHRPVGICRHLKVYPENVVDSVSYVASNGHFVVMQGFGDAVLASGPATGNASFVGWSNLVGEFSATGLFANLCIDAFNKQITQVPAAFSLFNSVYELKDFKPLIKSLSRIPSLLKNGELVKQIGKPVKSKTDKRKLPIKVAKSGVDTFLSWNLQWAPFIGDLETLSKLTNTLSKKLNFLRKTKGKEVTIRYSKPDCYTHPQLGQVVLVTNDAPADSYERIVLRSYTADFNSTWRLKHNLQELDDAWSGFKATLALIGANNPARIVWNAIPFSFMVDWVAPLGKWLDRTAVQPFTGQWDISDVSCSIKEHMIFDYYFTGRFGGTSGLVLSVVVDKYHRFDGLPVTLGALEFSNLSDTQQKLFLSIPSSKVLGRAL